MTRVELETIFTNAVKCHVGPKQTSEAFSRLEAAYDGRPYHNFAHVADCVEVAMRIAEPNAAVALALFYHDAVYDSRAKDNEERSAELARQELGAFGFDQADLDEIARLILLTKTHAVEPLDGLGMTVVDADLAILQTEPDVYDRYARAIREEYAWVPDEEYRAGRAAVLRSFLARPSIYFSDGLGEVIARENLRRELTKLV